jgi:hypothetical protein
LIPQGFFGSVRVFGNKVEDAVEKQTKKRRLVLLIHVWANDTYSCFDDFDSYWSLAFASLIFSVYTMLDIVGSVSLENTSLTKKKKKLYALVYKMHDKMKAKFIKNQ